MDKKDIIELDDALFDKLKHDGGERALSELFHRYWNILFRSSYNLLRDDDDAQDIVQEVFIDLWNRRYTVEIQYSIQAYLMSAVRYRSLTKITQRLTDKERNTPLEEYMEYTFHKAVDPLVLKELENEIDLQINLLPERMRQVIQLKTQECLSIHEIAQRLGISEETVKNHLAAARKRLRLQLRDVAYLCLILTQNPF